MTTLTYDSSPDEDAAMSIGLAITNGGLMSRGLSPIDLQGYFVLWVKEKISPMAMQALVNRSDPLRVAFLAADENGRQQLLAAAKAIVPIAADQSSAQPTNGGA